MNNILGLFKKSTNELEKGGISQPIIDNTIQCPSCKAYETKRRVTRNKMVCPLCSYHHRIGARERINMLVDKDSFDELFEDIISEDVLSFPGYRQKLENAKKATGENEAVICGKAKIGNNSCAVFAMESRFIMGSMGSAVGEKITRLFEYATQNNLPVIGFTASGGARMHEGILSLMQMAKVSGAVKFHSEAGNLYITVLTDPTTGGVTASFAMLGDIILAEPKALIGFAGKRVIEQTTKTTLPENFQSAEFVQEHGFVDSIVSRKELHCTLAKLLDQHRKIELDIYDNKVDEKAHKKQFFAYIPDNAELQIKHSAQQAQQADL